MNNSYYSKISVGVLLSLFILVIFFNATVINYDSTGTGNKDKLCSQSGGCINANYIRLASQNTAGYKEHIFLYWNITTLACSNYTVNNATINLTTKDKVGNNFTVPIHNILGYWIQTNNTIPPYDVNISTYWANASDETVQQIDVTEIVKSWVNCSSINYGVMLNGSYGDGSNYVTYDSFDATLASDRPILMIDYTIYPNVTIDLTPVNTTLQTKTFICNSTDPIQLKNVSLSIYNSTGSIINNASNITGLTNSSNFTHILRDDDYLWWCTVFNTNNNSITSSNASLMIDSINPRLNITTPANNTNSTNTNLNVNYTTYDLHLSSCWWSRNTTNSSITCGENITQETWFQGWNNVTIWSNDTLGNYNTSLIRFFIDNVSPVVNIISPGYYDSLSYKNVSINYTLTENGIGLRNCFYTNTSGYNVTLTCNSNFTVNQTVDGDYNVTVWANDTLGNLGYDIVHYTIATDAPAIVLNSPTSNQYLNNRTVYFNFTATDSNGLDTCKLWTNSTGTWHNNYTWVSPSSGVMNFTRVNLSDSVYKYNVWCNDTTGISTYASSNKTFIVDTLYPTITIDPVMVTAGSQTVSYTFNVNDTNTLSCKYSVYNSSGYIDGLNNNVSTTCGAGSATVSAYGTYDLKLYVIDYANWENSSNISFTTTASTNSTPGAGGGTVVQQEFIVIGENSSWYMKTDTGSKSYDFFMSKGTDKKKMLYFRNLGTEDTGVTLTCEDVSGKSCSNVVFSNTTVLMKASKNLDYIEYFTITLTNDTVSNTYDFNIVANNMYDNSSTKVSVRVRVGEYGVFGWIVNKLTGKTTINLGWLNDKLSDFELYNAFILLGMILFLSFLLFFVIFSWSSIRFPLTAISVFIVVFVLLFFLE